MACPCKKVSEPRNHWPFRPLQRSIPNMRTVIIPLLHTLAGTFRSRAALHFEVLALRQQLAVLHQSRPKRPQR